MNIVLSAPAPWVMSQRRAAFSVSKYSMGMRRRGCAKNVITACRHVRSPTMAILDTCSSSRSHSALSSSDALAFQPANRVR